MYHKIGSLLPIENQEFAFSQIIFNEGNELNTRKKILDRDSEVINSTQILQSISQSLKKNELYNRYKSHGIKIMNKPEKLLILKDDYKKINLKIYNKPVDQDFAALTSNNEGISYRDIIVENKSNKLKRIFHTHSLCDPLCYPLIFWNGKPQWNIQMKKETRITLRDYLNYHLNIRKNNFNYLFKMGKLFHQYVTQKYLDIETEDLNYLKSDQKKLRVELYKGSEDAFYQNVDLNDIGKR